MPIYEINFLISGIFKWLLLFGLSAFSANLNSSTASSVELEPVPATTGIFELHSFTEI